MPYEDIIFEEKNHVATITLNRPDRYNALRGQTYEELLDAIKQGGWNRDNCAIVLTGAGDRAFCTGGDQQDKKGKTRMGRGTVRVPIEEIHSAMRDVPVPVIAKVRGYAIGGGNVLATLCDLTIASDNAVFGQVGPKVGSVDPGFGTAYLARIVGEKKAREIWYLCRRYSAQEALDMGLINTVVPDDRLDAEVDQWCAELAERSPTAIALCKRSFNADTDHIKGIAALGFEAVELFYGTEESKEGGNAFREKRSPDFRAKRMERY